MQDTPSDPAQPAAPSNVIPFPRPPGADQVEPVVFDEADRIFLCAPAYGGWVGAKFTVSYGAAAARVTARFRGKDGSVSIAPIIGRPQFLVNESHIDRARNRLVHDFLESGLNWLLFIDADIDFELQDIAKVWMHGMRGHPIVCAPYALKCVNPMFPMSRAPDAFPDPETKLLEVRESGTGFMLIHRRVFEAMRAKMHEQIHYYTLHNDDGGPGQLRHAYFASGPHDVPADVSPHRRIWLSEDYLFCHRARALGFKIMLDTSIALGHFGNIRFPVPVGQVFDAVRTLRAIKHPECPREAV